ncbi:MAG: hypothetical protein ACP5QS_07895, partial [bacterium]
QLVNLPSAQKELKGVAFSILGRIYLIYDQPKDAYKYLKLGRKFAPDDPYTYALLGLFYLSSQKHRGPFSSLINYVRALKMFEFAHKLIENKVVRETNTLFSYSMPQNIILQDLIYMDYWLLQQIVMILKFLYIYSVTSLGFLCFLFLLLFVSVFRRLRKLKLTKNLQ